ncbi:MAG: NAD-dependent protein deacetylase, SIR2 family [Lachnospiraceae bacterium]|nr:NAD-dependent protein deacetylase, SIR2 family [Lachnospiraceae bacterium]
MATEIEKAKKLIAGADALLIGASNGLSIAEGYNIFADNEMFRRDFGEFRNRFGIRSVLDGLFFRYPTPAERHAFLSKLVKDWVTDYRPSEVMKNLLAIVGGKDYFIVTTNGDTHLEESGFDPDKVFELEGTFVQVLEGKPIADKSDELNLFISKYCGKKLVVLELGIGSRNRMIKEPLMGLVAQNPTMSYITLNLPHEIYIPSQIADRSVALTGDIADTLKQLRQ